MSRDSYDDMVSPGRGRNGNNGHKGLIALVCIVVVLIVVVLVLLFSQPSTGAKTPASSQSPASESVIVVTPESTTTPFTVITPASNPEKASTTVTVEKVEPGKVEQKATTSVVVPTVEQVRQVPHETAVDVLDARKNSISNPLVVKFITHVVKEGEDLTKIADLYGLKVQTLISVNQIRNVAALSSGTELQIPDRDGQYYTVQDGDMLSLIARRYNPELGWKRLQEVNGLKSENIKVGQVLFIPDPEDIKTNEVSQVSVDFKKPVAGSITGSYGQFIDDVKLTGLYISAPAGSGITAAADGSVVDVGNDEVLGRFVVLSHKDGYRTTYAYLERVEVKIGQDVSQGEIIGSIGTSDQHRKSPTLYFFVEQAGLALDPQLFI